jgi:hypothetical protein
MKYRQHGHNVVGIASGKINQFWRRWSNMWSDRAPRTSQQLIEFDRIYGDQLDARKRRQLKCLTSGQNNLSARIGALFSRDFQRQDFLDDMLIRLMMLIGRF